MMSSDMPHSLVLAWVPLFVARARGYEIVQLSQTSPKLIINLYPSDADEKSITDHIYQTGDDELDHVFDDLRGNNKRPSDLQARKLLMFRDSCAADLIDISKENNQLQASIIEYTKKLTATICRRVRKELHVTICTNLLSPLRSLPDDILEEFFFRCLPTKREARTRVAPLQLCHVCSQWRKVALRLPWLWDALDFSAARRVSDPFSLDRPKVLRRMLNLVDMWLLRSKQLSISLSFDISQTSQPSKLKKKLKDAIIPHTNRIREFNLHSATMHDLISFCEGSIFRVLERISLDIDGGVKPAHVDMIAKIFHSASFLRKAIIDMNSDVFHSEELLSLLPWRQLTHLSTYSISLDVLSWREMFEQCSALQYGIFTIDEFDDEDEELFLQFDEVITFSNLLSLQISLVNKGDVTCLHGYTFPALTSLHIDGHDDDFIWVPPADSFQLLSLHTLALTQGDLSADELIDFLRSVPLLASLTIDIHLNYDLILEGLTFIGLDRQLLPQLETLNMFILRGDHCESYDTNPKFTPMKLEKMVRLRWLAGQNPGVNSLKRIQLTFEEPEETEDLGDLCGRLQSLLEVYVSQGLQFDVAREEYRYDVPFTFSW